MKQAKRHSGWMTLAVVAGGLAAGVVVNMLRAIFAHAYGFLISGTIGFVFWYWIAMGAYRRAVRAPVDRDPPD